MQHLRGERGCRRAICMQGGREGIGKGYHPSSQMICQCVDFGAMSQAPGQRFPIGRVILCIIGSGLLCICVFFTSEYVRVSRGLELARTARMGEVLVDLSKAGQVRVPARFEFREAHGIALRLTGGSGTSIDELGARVAVAAEGDRELEWQNIELRYCRRDGDEVELFMAGGAPKEFAFLLDVQRPVAALAGQERKLYAKYEVCGLEGLIALVSGAFAIGGGVLSVAIFGGVMSYTRKRRRAMPTQV